ncbi:glycosyltransferase family 2 protein [Persephonella sp.]
MKHLKISVIIPTFNAENFLGNLLDILSKQSKKVDEIIIIDSSSTDNTIKIAKEYKTTVIKIPKEAFDHGGTRTLAARTANGDILIFLTQDALPYDNLTIKNIVNPFLKDNKIGAAYGRQIPYPDTNLFGKHLRYFNYPVTSYIKSYNDKEKFGIKTAFLSNSFAAYRRSVLEEIDWFKDNLILGEDIYAGAKILKTGYKIAYVSVAKVFHSHSYTVWQEFKRYFDIGVFHKNEYWILEEFGKPEGEGIRYLKSELKFLSKSKAFHLLPEFMIRNFLKYVGYKLGYKYNKIPKKLIKNFSMYSSWWDKEEKNK